MIITANISWTMQLRMTSRKCGQNLVLSKVSVVRCWTQPAIVLATVMILLTGCATGSSEQRSASVCPPVVAYTREERRRVAEEVDALPEGSVIVGWLADYMVLRGQLRVCR